MRQQHMLAVFIFLALILSAASGARATDPAPLKAPESEAQGQKSMADVNKQLNNPVADIWALNFQFKRYYLQGEATDRTRRQDLMNFQPVLPALFKKPFF